MSCGGIEIRWGFCSSSQQDDNDDDDDDDDGCTGVKRGMVEGVEHESVLDFRPETIDIKNNVRKHHATSL